MRRLIGRMLRWFLAAPATRLTLNGKTRAEVNAELRALGTPFNPADWRAP